MKKLCLILQNPHKTFFSTFYLFLVATLIISILALNHSARASMGKIGFGRITHTKPMESFHQNIQRNNLWPYTEEEMQFINKK